MTAKRTLWFAGTTLLLILGAVMLARREERTGGPRSSEGRRTEAASELAVGPALGRRDSPEAARSPAELERGETDGTAAETLEVRVVARGDGTPVAGAEVFLIDRGRVRALPPSDERLAIDHELEALGQRRISDRAGSARFPGLRGRGVAAARLAPLFARSELDAAEPGPIVLALEPDPPLRVRVLDRGGAPVAGVPVGLRNEGYGGGDLVRAATDEEGRAELFARGLHSKGPVIGSRRIDESLRIGLSVLLSEPVQARVDREHPPDQPIVLQLPPTGSLAMTLVDERGEPWREETRVWVELSERTQERAKAAARSFCVAEAWSRDGHAVLPWVGLGLELHVGADPREREARSLVTAGPEAAGERVELEIVVAAALPVLLGRILDAERAPIADAELALEARMGSAANGRRCVTDAAGRFRCALGDEDLRAITELGLVATELGGEVHHGRITAPRLGGGETDLGDIMLARSPVAVRGHVVDEAGRPVPRARVCFFLGAIPGQWYSGNQLREEARTDALGRFELREELEAASIGLQVEAGGYVRHGPEVVPLGTDGLRIVLARGGMLAGRLLFAPALWPTLELTRDGEPVHVNYSYVAGEADASDGSRRFLIGPLVPGVYSLACGYPWSRERARVDGLVVAAGEEARDPRLEPLDLRALLPIVALTIVDRAGRPVPAPRVLLPDVDSGELVDANPALDGERWLVAAGPLPLDLCVAAAGFRAQDLVRVDSDRRVVLESGVPVRLELVGSLPDLPAGWELHGEFTRHSLGAERGGAAPPVRLREAPFAFTNGAAEFCLTESGRYLFTFRVRRAGVQYESRASFWDEPPPVLEVRDDGTLQLFGVRAPSEATVREMLEYIAEQG